MNDFLMDVSKWVLSRLWHHSWQIGIVVILIIAVIFGIRYLLKKSRKNDPKVIDKKVEESPTGVFAEIVEEMLKTAGGRDLLMQTDEGRRYLQSKMAKEAATLNIETLEKQLKGLGLWEQILDVTRKQQWWKRLLGVFFRKNLDDTSHIGRYHRGPGNFQYKLLVIIIALVATHYLNLLGSRLGWYVPIPKDKTFWDVWNTYFASSGVILGIASVWAGVIAMIALGFCETKAGFISLFTAFGKYTGTVGPGLSIGIIGVNQRYLVNLGQQMLELDLSDDDEEKVDKSEKGEKKKKTSNAKGDVDLSDGTPVGVKAKTTYKLVWDRAQFAIFNTLNYEEYVRAKMDSLLRSFLSCYTFEQVNPLRGNKAMIAIFSGNYLDENGRPKKFEELDFKPLSESRVREILTDSDVWKMIRRDWGIEILDLNILDFDLPESEKQAREQKFQARVAAEKAVDEARRTITLADAEKGKTIREHEGYAEGIKAIKVAAETDGGQALDFAGKRLKYAAVKDGANAIMSDSTGGGSRYIEEGLGFGAGEEMWLNRNKKNAPPVTTSGNQQNKGVPNESNKDVRGGAGGGKDKPSGK